MNKLYLVLALTFILSLTFIGATEQSLGVFKQGECINLKQICANCTFNNITSVLAPNSDQAMGSQVMTKNSIEYTKQFCATSQIGTYIVSGFGDLDGTITAWTYSFEVTPSGTTGGLSGSFGFYIIALVIIVGLITLGFSIKEGWFVVIAGFCLMGLGIYSINSGIVGYRDMFMPWMIGLFEIGVGGYLAINSALEMQDIELS